MQRIEFVLHYLCMFITVPLVIWGPPEQPVCKVCKPSSALLPAATLHTFNKNITWLHALGTRHLLQLSGVSGLSLAPWRAKPTATGENVPHKPDTIEEMLWRPRIINFSAGSLHKDAHQQPDVIKPLWGKKHLVLRWRWLSGEFLCCCSMDWCSLSHLSPWADALIFRGFSSVQWWRMVEAMWITKTPKL